MRTSSVNAYARVLIGTLALGLGTAQAGSWSATQMIGGMDVWIYTPDSISATNKGSAMIALHGCAMKGTDMRDGGNFEVVAEAHGMVIATPSAPDGGVGIYGCWDYYDKNHTRGNRHNDNLIALGQHLAAREDVDDNRVYISGLSSGATQAQVTACLAPDVFAGVGSIAGPTMGTSESQAFIGGGSPEEAARLCQEWAGSNVHRLQTQLWNIAHGSSDGFVPYSYATQNIKAIGIIKGISKTASNSLPGATEEVWGSNKNATLLTYQGMDHRWAAGGDTGGGIYIDHSASRVNYAEYLARYFKEAGNAGPLISDLSLSAISSRISVSARIVDAEGSVRSASVRVYDALSEQQVGSFNLNAAGGDLFGGESSGLADGLYKVVVSATDNEGTAGKSVADTVRIGTAPAESKPTLSDTVATTSGQCVTISGRVVDANQNLDKVVVSFSNGNVTATVDGTRYEAKQCDLPGGNGSATITATDKTGLSASTTMTFTVDAGKTATLSEHINAGRLDYATAYGMCYAEYNTTAFKLTKKESGGQCRWDDADGSCKGPVVACDTIVNPDEPEKPEPETTCQDVSATNTTHATAGRATQKYVLLYYANGSNAYLGMGSATTQLYSTDGKSWALGSCP